MTHRRDVLIATLGSAGDVNPKIALGLELARRGHDVTLLTHAYHRRRVEAAGLPFIAVGRPDEYEQLMRDPDLWHPLRAFALLARVGIPGMLRPVYDAIAARDPARTLVVASGLVMAGGIAAETLGVAHVTVHLQPSLIQSLWDTPALMPPLTDNRWPRPFRRLVLGLANQFTIDRLVGPPVNAFRAELGLSPARGFFGAGLHSPLLTLGLWPSWYAAPQPDWPPSVRVTGFVRHDAPGEHAPPEGLEDFLAAGEAPVVFTPGTAMVLGERFFDAALDASRRLGRRALLLTPHREQLPADLPQDVAHVGYAPFRDVLPRAAAIVHHGGIGTVAQALAAGIPQLIMPMAHDQPDNARRVRALGVGDFIAPARFRGPRVARRLEALLGSAEVARRAAELAPRVDFDAALGRACDAIEDAAERADAARAGGRHAAQLAVSAPFGRA